MEKLTLYHGTPYKYSKPSWEKLDGETNGMLYGKAMYLTFNPDTAKDWCDGQGNVDKYELETEGLRVLDIREHGRKMYETLVKLKKEELDYDVLIIPSDCIDGYAEELFELIIIRDIGEEDIDEMCEIAESGETKYWKEEGQTVKFDLSNPELDIMILNEETLNKLIQAN